MSKTVKVQPNLFSFFKKPAPTAEKVEKENAISGPVIENKLPIITPAVDNGNLIVKPNASVAPSGSSFIRLFICIIVIYIESRR